MQSLWITQVKNEYELKNIASLEVADGTFDRLRRMRLDHSELFDGDCLIDVMNEAGDLVGDPLTISDYQMQWLLREFFKLPKRIWKRVSVR